MTPLRCSPLVLLLSLLHLTSPAQDTFSIVAVDTVTGEVGAAGATCLSVLPLGSLINRLLPGRGAVTAQASVSTLNRDYALQLMQAGRSPAQIIDSLFQNDSNGNPQIRQNLVVDLFNGGGRSAVFTGNQCVAFANHIVGPNYVIAGNILLGQAVLDSMEVRFLNESGDLAQKLMAALQGGKFIGADTRCTQYNTSSLSAYLRVAQPSDSVEQYRLDLNVASNPLVLIFESVDSLQRMFDQWLLTNAERPTSGSGIQVYPQPATTTVIISGIGLEKLTVCDLQGRKMPLRVEARSERQVRLSLNGWAAGIYCIRAGRQTERLLVLP
ncbi:MAG: DUF1028 domain-containing protein [Bacteroidota bacterium]